MVEAIKSASNSHWRLLRRRRRCRLAWCVINFQVEPQTIKGADEPGVP